MNLFYTPDIVANKYQLNESEAKHCIRVLRKKVGDSIRLVDGKGYFYTAKIIDDSVKSCMVEVISKEKQDNTFENIAIAIAPTKNNDRFEWFLEKATEIGIGAIYPFVSENSERKIIKPERLEKVLISAMKQSVKAVKPVLHDLTDFSTLVTNMKQFDEKLIAWCEVDEQKKLLSSFLTVVKKRIVFIGPEGDFTASEIELAKDNAFNVISFGESRLRTETAGIVAVSLMNYL